ELFLQLRLPEGTAFNVTEKSVAKAETLLKDDKDIATYTSYVGQGSPRFWLGLNPQLPNEAFAEIVIVAKDVEARERIKAKIENAVADGALSEARVRVDRFNFGPPVGFPVQFRVIGPDANQVRDIAYKVRDVVRENRNVKEVQLDWNEQSPYLKLVVDQGEDRECGGRWRAERSPRPRRPFQFRSAGRLSRAIPRDWSRRQPGARHRLQGARRGPGEPQCQGSPARLERAVALSEARRRS